MQALQVRGVHFLSCHSSTEEQVRGFAKEFALTQDREEIVKDMLAHTVPGVLVVASAAAALALLQCEGHYSYISVSAPASGGPYRVRRLGAAFDTENDAPEHIRAAMEYAPARHLLWGTAHCLRQRVQKRRAAKNLLLQTSQLVAERPRIGTPETFFQAVVVVLNPH